MYAQNVACGCRLFVVHLQWSVSLSVGLVLSYLKEVEPHSETNLLV